MTLRVALRICHEWGIKHHYAIPKAAVVEAFEDADTNKNGVVSKAELEAFAKDRYDHTEE